MILKKGSLTRKLGIFVLTLTSQQSTAQVTVRAGGQAGSGRWELRRQSPAASCRRIPRCRGSGERRRSGTAGAQRAVGHWVEVGGAPASARAQGRRALKLDRGDLSIEARLGSSGPGPVLYPTGMQRATVTLFPGVALAKGDW